MRTSEKYLRAARPTVAALLAERDHTALERDALVREREQILRQRDAAIAERNELSQQRDATIAERDALVAERDQVLRQRDVAITERDALVDESGRWFEAAIAVGIGGGLCGAEVGRRLEGLMQHRLHILRRIFGWRHSKRLIAMAEQASAASKWEIAARYYCEAIQYAPRKAALWVQFGNALKEVGKLKASEHAYRRSLQCKESSSDAHLRLGQVLALQNRANEAAESYLDSLRLAPRSNDAFYGLLALGWTAESFRSALQSGLISRDASAPRER
jgi:tetratricopeptide (TPR) repeat protein